MESVPPVTNVLVSIAVTPVTTNPSASIPKLYSEVPLPTSPIFKCSTYVVFAWLLLILDHSIKVLLWFMVLF